VAEFRLPPNSRVRSGKSWPAPQSKAVREFRIYRWNPDDDDPPRRTARARKIWFEQVQTFISKE